MRLLRAFTLPACLLVASALALAGSVAAEPKPGVAAGLTESIGPAAKGDPKPYLAQLTGECAQSECVLDFGKKKDKVRTIRSLTCLTASDTANVVALVSASGRETVHDYLVPPSSTSEVDNLVYSVFAWTQTFDVPAGAPLFIRILSGGGSNYAICSAKGEIK